MTDTIVSNVCKAMKAMEYDDVHNIALEAARTLSSQGQSALLTKTAIMIGSIAGTSIGSSPTTTPSGAAHKSKVSRGYFLREVIEYDPSVNNGFSITKGAFLNSMKGYKGSAYIIAATKGNDKKQIWLCKKNETATITIEYPSGATSVIEGVEGLHRFDNWKDLHANLAILGVRKNGSA
jgi:hypothetical protein